MLMLGDISGNNAENRRRELYTRTHIVDDSIGGAKTKTKTKTKNDGNTNDDNTAETTRRSPERRL